MVTDLWYHLTYDFRGAWHTGMPCSSQIIREMLPEIRTTGKCYFLKPIIHPQIILGFKATKINGAQCSQFHFCLPFQ